MPISAANTAATNPGDHNADDRTQKVSSIGAKDIPQHFRNGKLNRASIKILIHRGVLLRRDGENGKGVGANEHEARLSQREQAGESIEQVHGHADQRVNCPLLQHRNQHNGGGIARQRVIQHEKEDIQGHQ